MNDLTRRLEAELNDMIPYMNILLLAQTMLLIIMVKDHRVRA